MRSTALAVAANKQILKHREMLKNEPIFRYQRNTKIDCAVRRNTGYVIAIVDNAAAARFKRS